MNSLIAALDRVPMNILQGKTKNADLSGFGKKKTVGKGGIGSGSSDERRTAKKEADRLASMEVGNAAAL